ncbi:MAG: sodium:solute symporter family protein [Phycisphaeraceae bacterium]|nr:sodium:solute symporter family protein [Phycisphaeraceae bacterium]
MRRQMRNQQVQYALTRDVPMIPIVIIIVYLALLLALGTCSHRFFRGTSADFFVASRSIGPFMLLMSVFGTTMTAFALVGSTGKAFTSGIGVYGLMASSSGLIHSACFFLVGIRLWAIGKRHGYVTQCQFFRERFDSPALGYFLFPILVALIVPYLLIGLLGAGAVMRGLTMKQFPELFTSTNGAVPPWLTGLVICAVVLTYVFLGGVRATAWANTFQTIVFMVTGIIAFFMIAKALGGLGKASQLVADNAPRYLAREGLIGKWQFFTYFFVPLSVGMFPHLFQHWLTARSAKTFRITVIFHPLCIMIVWVPCILIGIWMVGHGLIPPGGNPNAILGVAVKKLVQSPWLTGLLTAGILAAIMSSLDSQFMCVGTMFTNDIVVRLFGEGRFSDKQKLWLGRGFVVTIVAITYLLSLVSTKHIFDLAVWCFSGFAGLFPIVLAAVYWRRATRAGAIAAVLVTTGVWAYLFHLSGYGGEYLLFRDLFSGKSGGEDGIMPVAVITIACAVTLVVVSLVTKAPSAATVDKFLPAAR